MGANLQMLKTQLTPQVSVPYIYREQNFVIIVSAYVTMLNEEVDILISKLLWLPLNL